MSNRFWFEYLPRPFCRPAEMTHSAIVDFADWIGRIVGYTHGYHNAAKTKITTNPYTYKRQPMRYLGWQSGFDHFHNWIEDCFPDKNGMWDCSGGFVDNKQETIQMWDCRHGCLKDKRETTH